MLASDYLAQLLFYYEVCNLLALPLLMKLPMYCRIVHELFPQCVPYGVEGIVMITIVELNNTRLYYVII